MIPTAAEFFDKGNFNNVTDMLIEFAKLHVEAALESAAKNTKEWHGNHGMLKQSILNAYPLTNIK